jgi:hypothetical protein
MSIDERQTIVESVLNLFITWFIMGVVFLVAQNPTSTEDYAQD